MGSVGRTTVMNTAGGGDDGGGCAGGSGSGLEGGGDGGSIGGGAPGSGGGVGGEARHMHAKTVEVVTERTTNVASGLRVKSSAV
jgi:hypothetical protein